MKRRIVKAIPMMVMFVVFAAASNRHAARNRACAIPLPGQVTECMSCTTQGSMESCAHACP